MLANNNNIAGGPPTNRGDTLIPPIDSCDADTYQLYDNVYFYTSLKHYYF